MFAKVILKALKQGHKTQAVGEILNFRGMEARSVLKSCGFIPFRG